MFLITAACGTDELCGKIGCFVEIFLSFYPGKDVRHNRTLFRAFDLFYNVYWIEM